jgi:hypothetical protein
MTQEEKMTCEICQKKEASKIIMGIKPIVLCKDCLEKLIATMETLARPIMRIM